MSVIHTSAILYCPKKTDKDNYFNEFRDWDKYGNHPNTVVEQDYVIQCVSHPNDIQDVSRPNFKKYNREIKYFIKDNNIFKETQLDSLNYKKANHCSR